MQDIQRPGICHHVVNPALRKGRFDDAASLAPRFGLVIAEAIGADPRSELSQGGAEAMQVWCLETDDRVEVQSRPGGAMDLCGVDRAS